MATLTILRQPNSRTVHVAIDIDRWERIADALGFYRPEFLRTLRQSLKESKHGRVRKIESLRELEL